MPAHTTPLVTTLATFDLNAIGQVFGAERVAVILAQLDGATVRLTIDGDHDYAEVHEGTLDSLGVVADRAAFYVDTPMHRVFWAVDIRPHPAHPKLEALSSAPLDARPASA